MTHLILPVAIGVIVSLVVFLFFERRAIAAKRASEGNTQAQGTISLPENLKHALIKNSKMTTLLGSKKPVLVDDTLSITAEWLNSDAQCIVLSGLKN